MATDETTFSVLTMIDTTRFAKELGTRIAACRKEQGLSQTQLGDLVGQSQQVIADYETGRRRIPACNLASIADALGVSTAKLLDGTEQPQAKRGPASKIDRLTAQIAKLPRTRQRFVIEWLEDAVARAQ